MALTFWQADALQGGLPDQRDDDRPQQLARFLPQRALGQADQHDARHGLLRVVRVVGGEDLMPSELRRALTEHRPQLWAQQDRAQLVHQRGDRLASLRLAQRFVPGPECAQPERIAPHHRASH